MIIAISSSSGNPEKEFSGRFGRCKYFLIMDNDTGDWEKVINPALKSRGGSGPEVVQFLSELNVSAAISGRYGPNAYSGLTAAGITAYLAKSGTPLELLEKFQNGLLKIAAGPSGPGLH